MMGIAQEPGLTAEVGSAQVTNMIENRKYINEIYIYVYIYIYMYIYKL